MSVLPTLSKIFEKIALKQKTNFIENIIIYHQCQSCYQKCHSTLTILLKLRNAIEKAMKSRVVTISILVDYFRAFDAIDFIFCYV